MEKQNNKAATHGSRLYPNEKGFAPKEAVSAGGVILGSEDIEYNGMRQTRRLMVVNRGDRPIQVGSHFHFFEVNRYLEFDREAAYGYHLNIPATTAIRFEPGDSREVELVAYGGKRRIIGFNSLVDGYTGVEDSPTYYPTLTHSMRLMRHAGFGSTSPKRTPHGQLRTHTTHHDNANKNDKTE